jgi:hypothetical protein
MLCTPFHLSRAEVLLSLASNSAVGVLLFGFESERRFTICRWDKFNGLAEVLDSDKRGYKRKQYICRSMIPNERAFLTR